ncbi:MAG TPA: GTPase HflX [Hydrogenophaga sp.]|jgi:GTP-binding protein HflX|uniref:GTPase HflX n=1 Tax=Hydrogenophaga TaxID=47420 RepID=UPI0008C8D4C1|nr:MULTISPECIES: GTPase HflX [Hydrogenophaga]MBW8470192.1 GTPase HflX [Thiobacillus sp.]OGA76033.1 MAG: GTPase HflX [Burkholderiales bacterium GWE1_65_30]OGA89816.1 MAG: GTPase HflX [Burkholderiales bacterium GWF1_66_17]OGB31556.1 MAG: GTPase HflX [Burkholderiales bacterium RIFCSPLOWO2_02_FULL_66_35]OGB35671.1 MAG: GTPase HflX [Burkholderiales bacterium RIFCSPHIGHO2_02_FULL_66_10]
MDLNPSASQNPSIPSVILVGVDFGLPHFDAELEELGLLAQTAGFAVADRVSCKRRAPDPALFVGSGKAEEIKMLAQSKGASEILFDQALSPAQQRNLERTLGLPVNDRTLLILQIFAQRARSHEGKLQVELARLQYLSTRLVRRWSHLERQSGGIGMRGGPGETQIELDRRMIGDSIKRTKERLEKVKKQRATQRRQRERRDSFAISLVGYTNAGKSSIFNALVKARAYAADQLFATLDTTTRQLYLGEAGRSVSLSDTVGFIRDLPHGLVDAFAATLQEAADADLLLHVVDASNPSHLEQIASVLGVLKDIGADRVPQILVFNKLDAMDPAAVPRVLEDVMELGGELVPRIFVSARTGDGLPALRALLAKQVVVPVGPEDGSTPGDISVIGDVLP